MAEEPRQGPSRQPTHGTTVTNAQTVAKFSSRSNDGSSPKRMKLANGSLTSRGHVFRCHRDNCSTCNSTTWTGGSITAADLQVLDQQLKSGTSELCVLLVDFRSKDSVIRNGIIANFIRTHIVPSENSVHNTSRMTTKRAVVNVLLHHYSNITLVLNVPGYYTHVIVFDEHSTSGKCSRTLVTLLTALNKWNENTRTSSLLLEEGFSNVKRNFASMIGITKIDSLMLPGHFLKIRNGMPNCLPTQESNQNHHREQVDTTFQALTDKLKYVANVTEGILILRICIYSLNAVKLTLIQEHERSGGSNKYPDIPIPVDMQCPVCFNLFSENIFQCFNGHSICSSCYENPALPTCPQCRELYPTGSGIRSRGLESLISTTVTFNCPFQGCTQKLPYRKLTAHMRECEYSVFATMGKLNANLRAARETMNFQKEKLAEKSLELVRQLTLLTREGREV